MNSTNRLLNRTFIVLAGLLLLAGGAALSLVATVPLARDNWAMATATILRQVTRWLQATPLVDLPGPINGSWLWLVAIAAGVVLIVGLVLFCLGQGHGRTGRLLSVEGDTNRGAVLIESKVAESAIQNALANHPAIVVCHVSTYRVKNRPVLKVAITCRRGISPREASHTVNEVLLAFDDLLGLQLPALVQISGGFRARTTKGARIR